MLCMLYTYDFPYINQNGNSMGNNGIIYGWPILTIILWDNWPIIDGIIIQNIMPILTWGTNFLVTYWHYYPISIGIQSPYMEMGQNLWNHQLLVRWISIYIHSPAILGFIRYQGFDPLSYYYKIHGNLGHPDFKNSSASGFSSTSLARARFSSSWGLEGLEDRQNGNSNGYDIGLVWEFGHQYPLGN